MSYILIIPAVWVLIGIMTWVSWLRDRKKYPPTLIPVSELADSHDIYRRYEPYNHYDDTQYN
jgi:hypothetical protein